MAGRAEEPRLILPGGRGPPGSTRFAVRDRSALDTFNAARGVNNEPPRLAPPLSRCQRELCHGAGGGQG